MNPVVLADNRFLDGTPTATDTATDYSALNIRDLREFTSWKAASSGTKYLTVDCGSAVPADTLAIKKHNLGTASASVSVESSDNGSSWTERLAPFTPSNDKALMKLIPEAEGATAGVYTETGSSGVHTETSAPGALADIPSSVAVSARYWRVKIVTASVAAEIAVCMLGERITFPYPPDGPYVPASSSVEADTTKGKTGIRLGSVVRFKPYKISPRWSNLARAWVESYFLPFWDDYASNLDSFFYAWDLDAYPSDVRFVSVPESHSFETPLSVLAYYDSIPLPMEGVKE